MTSLRVYSAVYVALMTLAASKFLFFEFLPYNTALGLTFAAATIKTGLIVGYFQHLKDEPRSLTYLMALALALFLLLGAGATFSVT